MSLRTENRKMYNSWRGMHDRCRSKTRIDRHCYAAKGISVCKEWDSFKNFHSWAIINGYSEGLTIDRIDGEKSYSPENCRWSTRLEQARNLSKNRRIECNGMTKCLSEWSEISGISYGLILGRLDRLGWDAGLAIFTPVGVTPTGPAPRKAA